jgi:sugar lactone lactonase YvrE
VAGVAGYLDGMTMDADGRLWMALSGGGAIHCYVPGSDTVPERVDVPDAAITTAVTFGGPSLDILYVTTSC